jgi:hypothetical protein
MPGGQAGAGRAAQWTTGPYDDASMSVVVVRGRRGAVTFGRSEHRIDTAHTNNRERSPIHG